jgi:hypothetical protein
MDHLSGVHVAPVDSQAMTARSRRAQTPCGRRRWSCPDKRYLERWAGVRPVCDLCRYLRRTERAVRCQLHKRGLSAKVREGWSVSQLQREFHLGRRTVLRHLSIGPLRLCSAQVRTGMRKLEWHTDPTAGSQRCGATLAALMLTIETLSAWLRCPRTRLVAIAPLRGWRLFQMRISEASVQRWVTGPYLGERRHWLSASLRQWWQIPEADDQSDGFALPEHLHHLHTCPSCRRQVRGNAFFRHRGHCVSTTRMSATATPH